MKLYNWTLWQPASIVALFSELTSHWSFNLCNFVSKLQSSEIIIMTIMYWRWYISGRLKFLKNIFLLFFPHSCILTEECNPGGTTTIFSSCFYKVGQVVCYEKMIIFNFKLKFCWNTFYTLTGCQKCCKLLLKIQMINTNLKQMLFVIFIEDLISRPEIHWHWLYKAM